MVVLIGADDPSRTSGSSGVRERRAGGRRCGAPDQRGRWSILRRCALCSRGRYLHRDSSRHRSLVTQLQALDARELSARACTLRMEILRPGGEAPKCCRDASSLVSMETSTRCREGGTAGVEPRTAPRHAARRPFWFSWGSPTRWRGCRPPG